MTRINSAIPPQNLTDQHLIAELRELPRIFTAVNKRLWNNVIPLVGDIPKEFTLGAGHCKFFYNKLEFLDYRHLRLRHEYEKRFSKKWQYKIDYDMLHRWDFKGLFNIYKPTEKERQLLIDRISTRITDSNQIPRYYGKAITKEKAIEILNK